MTIDDETAAYIIEVHKYFEDLRQVASQLAGLLVLAAASGKDPVPDHPMLLSARRLHQEACKRFHVSPFMGLDMHYAFTVLPPGERVSVAIDGHDTEGRLITAVLSGKRTVLSDTALLRLLATHPLLTLKVTAAIHWHALRLLAKRIRWQPHPAAPERRFSPGRAAAPHAERRMQP